MGGREPCITVFVKENLVATFMNYYELLKAYLQVCKTTYD